MDNDFVAALGAAGVVLAPAQRAQIAAHCALIRALAEEVSLVSTGDLRVLEERHVADSLALAPYIVAESPLLHLDIGPGGGFPGLVLAMALPDREFLLLERSEKKSQFLEHAVRELGIENAEVMLGEFPKAVQGLMACTVSGRAVEKPAKVWPEILRWLPRDSTYFCQLSGDPPQPLPKGIREAAVPPMPTDAWRRGNLRIYRR